MATAAADGTPTLIRSYHHSPLALQRPWDTNPKTLLTTHCLFPACRSCISKHMSSVVLPRVALGRGRDMRVLARSRRWADVTKKLVAGVDRADNMTRTVFPAAGVIATSRRKRKVVGEPCGRERCHGPGQPETSRCGAITGGGIPEPVAPVV